MGIVKVSNIIRMARDYNLPIEERMMFDWLVVKQEDFGIEKPFRHSITQIFDETGLSRYLQGRAIKRFSEMGFLRVGVDYYMNNQYKSFYVDFSLLCQPEVLSMIVKPETETYKDFMQWASTLAKAQKEKSKPISKYKRRQMENEKEEKEKKVDELYYILCETWKRRIDMFNNGELTNEKPERAKIYSQIPMGRYGKNLLVKLSWQYDDDTIRNGFTVYADKVLKGEISPQNFLLYFLTNEEGYFPVVDEMVNYHSMNYGCSNL